jgi:Flp pilus assembly protein CpaB
LLVTPAEAEALTLANSEGHIQLVLRNSTDQTAVATRGHRLYDLYGVPAPEEPRPPVRRVAARLAAPVAAAPATPPPPPPVVEPEQMIMIRGTVRHVQVFAKEQEVK